MYDFRGYLILALFFAVNLIITVVSRNYLIDKDYKTRYFPLLVIGFLILALDVSKQIRGLLTGYELNILPLYFCSFFNILYPIAAFSKGKVKQISQVMSSVYSLMVMAGLYIYPVMMIKYSAYSLFGGFDNFHTFTYHHLVMLYAMMSLGLQLVDLDAKEDLIFLVGGAVVYTIIGGPSAALLKVNFHSFYPTEPGFLTSFRETVTTPLFIVIWGAIFAALTIPGFYLFNLIYRFVSNRRIPESPTSTFRTLR